MTELATKILNWSKDLNTDRFISVREIHAIEAFQDSDSLDISLALYELSALKLISRGYKAVYKTRSSQDDVIYNSPLDVENRDDLIDVISGYYLLKEPTQEALV